MTLKDLISYLINCFECAISSQQRGTQCAKVTKEFIKVIVEGMIWVNNPSVCV